MKAIAVIPARGGSKRLPRKNIHPLLGKPLLAWTVEAALGSRYLGPGSVYVSTEDAEIADVARRAGAGVIERPADLAADAVWTQPVIRHAVETVAWMNACIPERTSADIDRGFERLISQGLREVISVDAEGNAYSAVRILRRDALFQDSLSVVFAVFTLDYLDVHTTEDLAIVERRLRERSQSG